MNAEEIIRELASFATGAKYEDIPAPAMHEAKILFMDSIGCGLAALTTDKGKMTVALSKRLGGPPESSIIGISGRVSCSSAALANGELIGTVDYDATMHGGHAPPYVLPAPLAMAEYCHSSGRDMLLAIALGMELSARVAGAVQQSHGFGGLSFDKSGKRQQWSWGTRWGQAYSNFGAAAAAGRLIGLNTDKMVNALGIAGHLCQVLTHERYTMSGHRHMTKYGVPGWQNTGAIAAALLAEMGYLGDTTVFDAEEGFWKFVGYEEWHPDIMMKDLGKQWMFPHVNYKLYPCCGMHHGALDCLYRLLDREELVADEIEAIRVFSHPTVAQPCFTNPEVINIPDAQFNPKYVFSVAAHRVRIGVEWQDPDTMKDPKILAFGKKIECTPHPDFGRPGPDGRPQFISRVEVVARGKTFVEESNAGPRGMKRGTELKDEELVAKFRHNAARALTQDKTEQAIEGLLGLEKVADMSALMDLVTML
jgi:2-methylcitrate dehydratase PrpD